MGGGAVWSRVARLATAVSPAVRTASPSTSSCSFCKLNSSLQAAKQATSAKMHSCACSPETTPKAVTVSQGVKSMWDSDEWEFAEEEEKIDHLVFGPLPSQQEVEDASRDLQNALRLGLLAPACDDLQAPTWGTLLPATAAQAEVSQSSGPNDRQHSGGSNIAEGRDVEEIPKPASASGELDWMEPPPIRSSQNALQARGRSPVLEAFYQFENNPEVKGMVVSLATDPNIWGAVMANKEIQEFSRKLQGEKVLEVDKTASSSVEDNGSKTTGKPSFFERCQIFWLSQISQFMDVLNGLINSLFKVADKKTATEEGGDFVDRTVKSCTMLALVVLFVVILKRLSVQAV